MEILWNLSGGGLANKIKWWVSSMRIRDYYNLPIKYFWVNGIHLSNCDFNDLFDNKIERINDKSVFQNESKYIFNEGWRLYLFENDIDKNFSKVYPIKSNDIKKLKIHNIGPFNGECIDFEYNRIPKNIIDIYLKYFKSIIPNKNIQNIVENFISKYIDNDVIGVHIRRTDHMKKNDRNTHTDEKYFVEMNKILEDNPNIKFFICTDCILTQKRFIKKYPNCIYYKKRDNLNIRNTKTAIQDAFIDILILSKLKYLLVSPKSTFTEVAWWFGECKAFVKTIE